MKERLQILRQSERISGLYGILALLVCLHYLVVYAERFLIWGGHENVFNALRMLHALLIVFLLGLFLLKLKRGLPPETWLLAAYCAWVLITRVINRDYTLYGSLYFSAVCAAVFAVGAYLTPQQRRRILDCLAATAGGWLFFLAVLCLLVWFGGEDAYPGLARFINTNALSGIQNVFFFNTVHNMSAAWFAVGLFLMAYEWTVCKSRIWRIPIAVNAALMYIMIALQHCRSIQVASSVGIGMLAVLAMLPALQKRKPALRTAAIILVALSVLLLSFEGLSLCGDIFAKGLKVSQQDLEELRAYQEMLEELLTEEELAEMEAENQETVQTGSDSRSFLHDALTLTERTDIWKAAFRLMREDLHAAMFGLPEESMMDAVNSRGNYREVKQHTHNLFIQAMVLTGIPGALMLLAFTVLQLVRMIRGYFDDSGRMKTENKVLLVLPAVLLVYGMAEVLLNRLVGFASLSFLLAGGIYTETCREAFRR